MKIHVRSFAFFAALSTLATAQSTEQVVPALAAVGDGQESMGYPFGHDAFRFQQVFDAASVAPIVAVVDAIRFRADRLSTPFAGTTIPNVEVWLGYTSAAAGALSVDFATNRTGAQTSVFQGTVSVPATPEVEVGLAPWNVVITLPTPFVYDASLGNLLLEIAAANTPAGPNGHFFDAAEPGGTAVEYGRAGQLSNFDNLNLTAHHGFDLIPDQIKPGGSLHISTTTSFSTYPGALMIGFSNATIGGFPLPLDFGAVGAPGNKLYQDVVVSLPLTNWNSTFIGHEATVQINFTAGPNLVGFPFYAQAGLLDPSANAFGLVTSEAFEVVLGTPSALPVQALVSPDPASVSGTLPNAGGDPLRFVGAVVRFDGVF